jgi:putative hydrolase of the HAD superfamily
VSADFLRVKNVKHIFFDLDHTLWDFDRNSAETLLELFETFNLSSYISTAEEFIEVYKEINAKLWKQYALGEINKVELRHSRFRAAFSHFSIRNNDQLSEEFSAEYLRLCPLKSHLIPGAKETLTALRISYRLHVITNGFMEIQQLKIASSGIEDYFDLVLCSEEVGFNKPHPEIFRRGLRLASAKASESVMVGDTYEADIVGAKEVGMHTILFNPQKDFVDTEVVQIHALNQLIDVFA